MRILFLLAAASLAGCAATPPPPLTPSHPASPEAAETPMPEVSRALEPRGPAASPAGALAPPEDKRGAHHAH
jgi:hypothetical protein